MADSFVKCYQEGLFLAFGNYEKFLAICPDTAWQQKGGGWTLAQQYYHGLMATNMLMASISGKPVANPNPEAGQLEDKPEVLPDKAEAAQFLANIKAGAAEMFAELNDNDLLRKNEIMSQKFGRDVSNALVLERMASHMLYHLGSCDAELRDRNLPGSW